MAKSDLCLVSTPFVLLEGGDKHRALFEAKELAQKAYGLLSNPPWNYSRSKINHLSNDNMGYLEHMVHEMAHAASLGIVFDHQAPKKIGSRLIDADDFAIGEEAKALAIGWRVWQELRMPFSFEDLLRLARDQEVKPGQLDYMLALATVGDLALAIVTFLRSWNWESPDEIASEWRFFVGGQQ